MGEVRLAVRLDESTAGRLLGRAAKLGMPVGRYLAELIRADDQRRQGEVAAEGYRVLSADTGEWAEVALPLAAETWPEWDVRP